MKQIQWGKVLVFFNLVLAMGMAAWALGLYTGRIEWGSTKAGQGEVAKRQATLKTLENALTGAETRQRAALASLHFLEPRRPRDERFYQEQENRLEKSNDIILAVDSKDGQIVLTPEGLPRMVPFTTGKGEQLKGGLAFFTQQFQQTQAALMKSIEEYQQLVAEDVKLTERIIGDKGLQQLLFNEQDIKQARVKQEIEDLKPVYINVLVETQLLTKRQKALQARLDEVRKSSGRAAQH